MSFKFHRANEGVIWANTHRGYSSKYPENTMPAFEGALQAEAPCIELDFHMTADNQLIVTHDHRIDRVSNGSGFVEKMFLAELNQYDFGTKFDKKFSNTTAPLLKDVLEWAVQNNAGLIIEAKQRLNLDAFVENLVTLLRSNSKFIDHVQLLSFNHVLINQVKKQLPNLALQVVTLERYNNQLAAVQQSNASCVCFEYEYTHIDDLRAYKKAGLGVRLYLHEIKEGKTPTEQYDYKFGVDSRTQILAWMREGLIDMISHDDVDYMKSLIKEAGYRWI